MLKDLDRIAVVGVGLLGGSVGLACRAAGLQAMRIGIGRRRASLNRARQFDAVDEITLSYARGLRGTRLVVLASPVGKFATLLERMAPHVEPGTVVTDVGSTKADVVRIAEKTLPKHCHFVGSHPIAGSEKTGVAFARADLFDGAACFVTPTRGSARTAVALVRALWTTFGARVKTITPERHDEVLAHVSHLPHAIAALLITMNVPELDAAGTGLMDMTRVASGDPGLWRDIFASNRGPTLRALDEFVRQLEHFRQGLSAKDYDAIAKLLTTSKKNRDHWIARKMARKELPS